MNRFLILSRRVDDIIHNHSYAYYWEEGYEYVDARFLPIGKSKKSSLNYLRLFCYKLFYINTDKDVYDVYDVVSGVLRNKTENGKPIYLMDMDVLNMAERVYNDLGRKDISRVVRLKSPYNIDNNFVPNYRKHIEFKYDLRGLLEFNKKEQMEYVSLANKTSREKYMFNHVKNKKREYAKGVHNKHKSQKTKHKIMDAIYVLSEFEEVITTDDVAELVGLSKDTVDRYVDEILISVDKLKGIKVFKNKNIKKAIDIEATLKKCYKEMLINNGKVNKSELHRLSKVSRVTINKYWDKVSKTEQL